MISTLCVCTYASHVCTHTHTHVHVSHTVDCNCVDFGETASVTVAHGNTLGREFSFPLRPCFSKVVAGV